MSSWRVELATRIRLWRADLFFCALGVVIGLPSWLYPFGRDQGLYYYVAREWVLRGAVPYRDTLDHKTPGIYLLHALSITLFGEVQWGIRVLELCGVVVFGLAAGALLTPRGTTPRAGTRGATVALSALLVYGYLDFWNTAQTELWYSGFGIASVWAVLRIVTLRRALWVSGLLAGAALLMKPPALCFVLVAVGALIVRSRPRPGRSWRPVWFGLAQLALAGAVLPALVLVYFASKHALDDLVDVVVHANAYYVQHESGFAPDRGLFAHLWEIGGLYAPFSVLLPLGLLLVAHKPRADAVRGAGVAAVLLLAGTLAVVMQGKYYLLHWAACCLPLAACGVVGLEQAGQWIAERGRAAAAIVVVVVAYLSTVWLPHTDAARSQWRVLQRQWAYVRGTISREELNAVYALPALGFWYAHSHRVGEWLRVHTSEADTVTVRGFQPEIYAVCGRRHSGRFFWTTFLTQESRRYRRKEWRAEDRTDLQLHPPKYVVSLNQIHEGPDSSEWFATLGYVPVVELGELTILAKP